MSLIAESIASDPDIDEKGLGDLRRCQSDHALGELDRRFVAPLAEQVHVGQLLHLPLGSLGQPLFAEAERRAPKARQAFDVAFARVIGHPNAVAARDHEGPLLLVEAQVGVGVHADLDVAGLERVRDVGHDATSGRRTAHLSFAQQPVRRTGAMAGPQHATARETPTAETPVTEAGRIRYTAPAPADQPDGDR